MSIEAFVPLKTLPETKHRLAEVLNESARLALVVAMAEDVIARLRQHPDVDRVHVICGEGWEAYAFLQPPIRLWRESDLTVSGLNAVLSAVAADSGADGQLFIHADLPFLSHEDISAICSRGRDGTAILCPDRHRVGTNALLRWRAQSLALSFGERSYGCHSAAAQRGELDWSEISTVGLGTDIDTADDIQLLQGGDPGQREGAAILGDRTRFWSPQACG